jgi:nitrate/nitrite transporter NarK
VNATQICLVVGLALGFAGAFGGFGAFTIVLVFAAIGLVVGRWLDGELDLDGVLPSAQRKGKR